MAVSTRKRGRQFDDSVARPPCPRGHAGTPRQRGRYATTTLYERRRWLCKPADGGKPHTFSSPLPSRHPTPAHPHAGSACAHCERAYAKADGPLTGRSMSFALREVAQALVLVGQGQPLRKAARLARRAARRFRPGLERSGVVSRGGNIVFDWLDILGEVVLAEPDEWPELLTLDEKPLRERAWDDIELRYRQGGKGRGAILGAYGYTRPKIGQLWKVSVAGGSDAASWAAFLRSLPGEPRWVIADGSKSIARAVREVFPNAQFFACEWHLHNRASEKLAACRIPRLPGNRGPKVYKALDAAFESPDAWEELKKSLRRYARAKVLPLAKWIDDNEYLVASQFELRKQIWSRSVGPLEQHLRDIGERIGDRSSVFANARRFNIVLGLIRADIEEIADEHIYYKLIRDYLQERGGRWNASWREARDRKGQGSIKQLVEETLTAKKRRRKAEQLAANSRRRSARLAVSAERRQERGVGRPEPQRATYRSVAGHHLGEYAELISQWSVAGNPGIDPMGLPAGSRYAAQWECDRDPAHVWRAQVITRTARRTRCPYCTHRLVAPETSLAAVFPEIAAQWHPTRNTTTPADVFNGADREAWWKCPSGHVYRMRVNSRTTMGYGCPKCGPAKKE